MANGKVNPHLLITGATGFTGRHACEYFAGKGWKVTAAIRQKAPASLPAGVQTRICELRDREQVKRMIGEVVPDYVLHLAGKNSVPESWQDPVGYMEANVMAPIYLLEAMRLARPEGRILLIGSLLGIDPALGPAKIPHPYSLSKTLSSFASEAWHVLFRQSLIVAEPSNLVGPGESTGFCMLLAKYIAKCERGEQPSVFKISSRHATRNFLDVRDAVAAYERLLSAGTTGEVYPVTAGTECTLGEVAEMMLAKATCPVRVEWGNAAEADSPRQSAENTSKKLHDLGWKPEIPLDRTIGDVLKYARSRV